MSAILPHLSIEEMDNRIDQLLNEIRELLRQRLKMADAEHADIVSLKAEISTYSHRFITIWAHGKKSYCGMGTCASESINDYIEKQ